MARRIDAIRITNERYNREIREQEIGKPASEAELRALRAQINPHFRFNALTTIGYLIQSAPPRALETLMRLTALLRGVLRSEGEFTTLASIERMACGRRQSSGRDPHVQLPVALAVFPLPCGALSYPGPTVLTTFRHVAASTWRAHILETSDER